jgi:hypothetical protein
MSIVKDRPTNHPTTHPTTQSTLRVIKVGTCTNLSGKHKLSYHIGCDADAVIHFRIYANSGNGYFSNEWVSLDTMQKAIEAGPIPTTSFALYPLFKGKSVNTPAFLLAALLSEGLVQIHSDNQRCYATTSQEPFITSIKQLIESGASVEVDPIPQKQHKRVALIAAGPVNRNLKIKSGRPLDSQKQTKP